MSVTIFECAGCGLRIPKDRFETEYAWWADCVDHYDMQHPDAVAVAEEPS